MKPPEVKLFKTKWKTGFLCPLAVEVRNLKREKRELKRKIAEKGR